MTKMTGPKRAPWPPPPHLLTEKEATAHPPQEAVVVRFADDSGDSMQLTGGQFTLWTALAGKTCDVPRFPAESARRRARPSASTPSRSTSAPLRHRRRRRPARRADGDEPRSTQGERQPAPRGRADHRRRRRVHGAQPRQGRLQQIRSRTAASPLAGRPLQHLAADPGRRDPFGLGNKEALRCKTCGRSVWPCGCSTATGRRSSTGSRPSSPRCPALAEANIAALNAGHAYGETVEMGAPFKQHHIAAGARRARASTAPSPAPRRSRSAWSRAASSPALKMFFGAYPITPGERRCSTISSRLKEFGITTFQAEDEIAAICAAIGASYAGQLGITSSSGPGIALKTEGDRPCGHDRAAAGRSSTRSAAGPRPAFRPRPSSPTSTRRSTAATRDAPLPVIAARSPADAFDCAIEACRIATRYMTPVMLLTDGYIANAAEPWRVPDMSGYAAVPGAASSTRRRPKGEGVMPYRPRRRTSRGRGSSRARRASSTASAASRSSPAPATSITRPPPTRR